MTGFFRGFVLVVLGLALATRLDAQDAARPALVTVQPKLTDAILANPGMGWETFHRTANDDPNLPPWIPSTVHYVRWGWAEVEPRPDGLATAMIDRQLARSREAGQSLAFRVMCCSSSPDHPYHPAWLVAVGGREIVCRYEQQAGLRVPDLDHPVVLARHLDLIRRLGERYDGHPDLDHVDLGSVGWWGEWHMSGSNCKMPSPETQRRIVEAYQTAFRKTPLLMLIGGGEMLRQAVSRGAGWRADCIGDLGGFSQRWNHMRHAYPVELRQAGGEEVWRQAPVAWETCWDIRKWVDEGWPLRTIFNYALAFHGSYLNNKSAPLPQDEQVRAEIERFLRRLGYRLELMELRHPPGARAGAAVELAMRWRNTGSAPCYRPYRLAYRLTGDHGRERIFTSPTLVNAWMPGQIELFTDDFFHAPADLPPGPAYRVANTLTLPADWPAGQYDLSVGVVGDDASRPLVRLGIAGRDDSGWYRVSRIEILP